MNSLANQASHHYQRAQVESATPEKLVLMLYDGAVRKISQAESHFKRGDTAEFHSQIVKVQKIISELMLALDQDEGGEVVDNLTRLYDYMLRQLALALVRKSPELAIEVRSLLEELRDAWKGAIEEVTRAAETAEDLQESHPSQQRPTTAEIQAKVLEPVMAGLNIQG